MLFGRYFVRNMASGCFLRRNFGSKAGSLLVLLTGFVGMLADGFFLGLA